MKRKVCVVTGSRADYGLLRQLMKEIQNSSLLQLQLIATGMHLSAEFGFTFQEIKNDGFIIDRNIDILLSSDSAIGVTKSIGLGLIGFADAVAELKPDILLLLGDRFEIFSSACSALIAQIPIAHLHGGEVTEGAFDDAMRHSITKMSHIHFVATEEYRRRVIQLGEDPRRVYLVGGLGVDSINCLQLYDKNSLEKFLDFSFAKRNLLVTFHPETLDPGSARLQLQSLLDALDQLRDTHLIFTMPNADTDGRMLMSMIRDFVVSRPHARAYTSLGQLNYLSCMQFVDAVVGNSSSGLLEAPTFKIGTINIGRRQQGRLKAKSVIDCEPNTKDILNALMLLYSANFCNDLQHVINPYGEGGASKKIVRVLENISLEQLINKKFHNLYSDCELP
jgi:GDP/UDP-N,N'-diacetylbacillosamine 2-epimerase (hydrolysing)